MNGVGVSSGPPSGPEVQLHKLCSHLVGRGAGGSDALVTSHYESALKLLTSPASHGRPGKEEEVALVERLVKSLARRGREREGAQVVALHQKLVGLNRDAILIFCHFHLLVWSCNTNVGTCPSKCIWRD